MAHPDRDQRHPAAEAPGRARLLACATCRELVRCEACGAAVDGTEDGLCCRRCATVRPKLCLACGGTRLATLRVGVTRAREELELLASDRTSWAFRA